MLSFLSSVGFLRHIKQQQQKIRLQRPGFLCICGFIGNDSEDCNVVVDIVDFFLQQLQHEFDIRVQHGKQHLKQFILLKQLLLTSSSGGEVICDAIF